MVYQQDVSQSAGFVGQSAVSTGYAQMPARQHDPQVRLYTLVRNKTVLVMRKVICLVVEHYLLVTMSSGH